MGQAGEQLLRDLARAGISPIKGETERSESCWDCPFMIQDEDTRREVCGSGSKIGECDERH